VREEFRIRLPVGKVRLPLRSYPVRIGIEFRKAGEPFARQRRSGKDYISVYINYCILHILVFVPQENTKYREGFPFGGFLLLQNTPEA